MHLHNNSPNFSNINTTFNIWFWWGVFPVEPQFDHFGEVYKNVDMRGEVALVNRNILIEGEPTSDGKQMGGHIKVGYCTIEIPVLQFIGKY